MIKTLSSTTKYTGRVVTLTVDEIRDEDGRRAIREVVRHPGGAVIVPLFNDGTVLLVRQYRHPAGGDVLELPAGKLEPGEPPLECARRELSEETGLAAARWEPLVSLYTSPGFCDEVLHLFLAQDLSPLPDGQHLDEGESRMSLERVPLAQARAMIAEGTIRDAKTICGILLAANRFPS